MNFVVVPLSIAVHVLLIGIPIAIFARRAVLAATDTLRRDGRYVTRQVASARS
jgi:hypothetical protein